MKFVESTKNKISDSIFAQTVSWRVTLTAITPGAGRSRKTETKMTNVADTLYRHVALHTAHHAIDQHSHKLGEWDTLMVSISKHTSITEEAG